MWLELIPENIEQVRCMLNKMGFNAYSVYFPTWIGAYNVNGMLTKYPEAPSDWPRQPNPNRRSQTLSPPKGQTELCGCGDLTDDSMFIVNLLMSFQSYNNNLPYDPTASKGVGYNSNSFISNMLKSVGYTGEINVGNTVGSSRHIPGGIFGFYK